MTPQEFTEAKARLGWTHAKFARALGVNERTVRRWSSGESSISGPVAYLIRFFLKDLPQQAQERDSE